MNIYDENYFKRGVPESDFFERGILRPDQHAAILYAFGFNPHIKNLSRTPSRVLSVGCGQGMLESQLVRMGVTVYGLDIKDYREKSEPFYFIEGTLNDVDWGNSFDTIIFCESLEHIPIEQFEKNWSKMVDVLRKTSGLLIVTNWEDYHPLQPNGFDHVTLIDNAFYERMARNAKEVLIRKGSHLVLKF